MKNMLRDGDDWLARQQRLHTSSPISYTRNASVTEMRGMIARIMVEVQDAAGMLTRTEMYDVIIAVEDLTLDDIQVTPAPGDRIVDIESGEQYEVTPMPGEDCWRWASQFQTQRRIHTKRIGNIEQP